ncbi:unnamed protein product [Pleuronectes platessa]|uniref:Uncharacterized protein n=1 Tax=Pleuronectes platessa TaxID=8262 RepID=A0A9N7YNE7_PLEPL|nr:unnamed protein product [Pleuronectes platessa]
MCSGKVSNFQPWASAAEHSSWLTDRGESPPSTFVLTCPLLLFPTGGVTAAAAEPKFPRGEQSLLKTRSLRTQLDTKRSQLNSKNFSAAGSEAEGSAQLTRDVRAACGSPTLFFSCSSSSSFPFQ